MSSLSLGFSTCGIIFLMKWVVDVRKTDRRAHSKTFTHRFFLVKRKNGLIEPKEKTGYNNYYTQLPLKIPIIWLNRAIYHFLIRFLYVVQMRKIAPVICIAYVSPPIYPSHCRLYASRTCTHAYSAT